MPKSIPEACLLIVDSDPLVRHPVAEYLRECGYKVLEAINTDEAAAVLSDDSRIIDVVLCDVNSPGQLGGFGLARWVRENGLAAQVILAGSVSKAAEAASNLCEEGPTLSKPYDHEMLLARIKGLTRRPREADD